VYDVIYCYLPPSMKISKHTLIYPWVYHMINHPSSSQNSKSRFLWLNPRTVLIWFDLAFLEFQFFLFTLLKSPVLVSDFPFLPSSRQRSGAATEAGPFCQLTTGWSAEEAARDACVGKDQRTDDGVGFNVGRLHSEERCIIISIGAV